MLENIVKLKKVKDLLKEEFLVKSYQRGYKWTKTQIEDLLDDIEEFDNKKDSFYCLQPIIVKEEDGNWELIDGQQRLTTIYIILSVLNRKNFSIDYQTREASSAFLKDYIGKNSIPLSTWEEFIAEKHQLNHIDNYHFFNAYQIVQKWLEDKRVNIENFWLKLTEYTEVIWYQINDGSDSREIFTRINSGKIPLTNAELIKALFLISYVDTDGVSHLQQRELAQEWDRIEYALQNDEFWYFLNKTENKHPTRIEFIFDLISGKKNNDNAFFSFNYFRAKIKDGSVQAQWGSVKKMFLTLQEWHDDHELYHYIGFLITFGEKIDQLLELSRDKTKKAFKEELRARCRIGKTIDQFSYREGKEVRKLLLLFNIVTLMDSKSHVRFPFDKFKKDNWDIEHIHANKSEAPNSIEHWKVWFKETSRQLKLLENNDKHHKTAAELLKKCSSINFDKYKEESNAVLELYYEIVEFYSDNNGDADDISNLTLLDAGTNRSFKNAIFPVKREVIIDRDGKGKFIPICTKNVFLKYYSPNATHLHFWGSEDRNSYREKIRTTLESLGFLKQIKKPSLIS
ncbi:DUF262 domain-containing protein [uncultured Pontibacter sp.]|uniref:DUF262 domain-containing protein n=1 Tax=uncultured Pontibacter sp. TaxID=453356 RepID=UPI002623F515|nr:DUF262 domain-containing protein [uncultured Pontibacter sp.]